MVFIYKNIDNYELVLEAVIYGFAGIQSAGMFISIGLNVMNIKALHLKLQKLIDTGNFKAILHSKRFYV